MISSTLLACTVGVLMLAAFTRATIGFGDALLAMPLLTLMLDVKTATPLVALSASLTGITILARRWHQLQFRAVWRLLLSALIGIPIGLWGLTTIPKNIVKMLLGLLLIAFGLYNLTQPHTPKLKNQHKPAYIAGFLSGVIGGAYNLSGPPVIVYASLCRWPSERFIATLQGYFMPTGFLIIFGHVLAGLWTPIVLKISLLAAPAVLLGVWLGDLLSRKISPGTFDRLVYLFLLAAGLALLL